MRRLFFDRNDGYRIKHKDPIMRLIPYIMQPRYDAQVFFEDTVDLTNTESVIRAMRKEGTRVIFLHIVLAAILRTMVDYPKMHRFVKGRKVYARKFFDFSFAIKRSMDQDGEETIVKVRLEKTDTLDDVVKKVNEAIEENREVSSQNKTDKAAKFLNMLPGGLIRLALFFVNILDNYRLMPKFLVNASPFHTSAFVTDLGSLGINPVFHHLYDFGTTSIFAAFGTKKRGVNVDHKNTIQSRRELDLRVVIDERINDGYYMALCVKRLKRYLENPERLHEAPKSIPKDDEIR